MSDTTAFNPQAVAIPAGATDPFGLFASWFAEAKQSEINDPNAMIVATCTLDGLPSARTVLMKGYDEAGFVFYTNKESRKGDELAANPRAALLFYWKSLHRQVRIEGVVEDVTDAEADAYYNTRARVSRLGAWASIQSRPLSERGELVARLAEMEARYPGDDVPRPPNWSGYRVVPTRFEFWQDMPYRLHDRSVFTPAGQGWASSKLYP
jgi:pyridoxamine 5'-phosphate oxidase